MALDSVTDDQMVRALEAILGSLRAMNDQLWWVSVGHMMTTAVLICILIDCPRDEGVVAHESD